MPFEAKMPFEVKKTSEIIIIPSYNEEKHIAAVIKEAKKYAPVIVVDDGSKDNTAAVAKTAGATVLRHKVNLGKGAALKTGCEYALAQGAQHLVSMDADGQHNPTKIPLFLAELKQHDIVLGARAVPESMPLILLAGNKIINTTLGLLYGIHLKDSQCGYRAFTAEAYQKVRWGARNYYVETEMVIRAGKKHLQYTQIPIETIYYDKYKGTTVIDGITIVARMIGARFFK
ncbi:glycosyltransferase family 2 protein [Candidatus Woesearchaeota archaeon]|nr:glycosyltransferase family 2 protein [Candidatus Woesearchaeota archaeon]